MARSRDIPGERRAGCCVEAADLRKSEIKGCPFVFFGFRPNAAAVPKKDALNVREADACAFEFLFEVEALEDAEEFANVLHIETYTIIAHKYNVLISSSLRAELDFSTFSRPRIFNGIGNEVGKDDTKHGAVADDFGQGTEVPLDGTAPGIVLQTIDDFGNQILEIDARDAHLDTCHARELKEVID